MSDDSAIQDLMMPYHNQKQGCNGISKGVYYMGYFMGFGEQFARHRLWSFKKGNLACPVGKALFRSQDFQEKSLDRTLSDLKDCVVFSTTPTYFSQFQAACLLKARGFQLLEGLCYRHPEYKELSKYRPEHPGIPDRYQHWEHIWWKVIGEPKEIGVPSNYNQLNNCGVDSVCGLDQIANHDKSHRRNFLTVAWLPRGTAFPKGWKRFFSASDYKLGVNFDLISGHSKVQTCDHNFDMSIFKDWEPDFEKWSPC